MEVWVVLASIVTAIAGMIAAGGAIWLAFQNRQLVKASLAQVRASQDEVQISQVQVVASQEQVAASQEQARLAQEAIDAQVRPILVPEGDLVCQPDHPNWLKWGESYQPIAFRNLGPGAAFNVMSVLYGCSSYLMADGRQSTDSRAEHWTCAIGVPLPANSSVKYGTHTLGGSIFTEENMHIMQYSLNAPDEPSQASILSGVPIRVARVTITYQDLSANKYASIFDFIPNLGWQMVTILPHIEHDLHELEGAMLVAPDHD